MHRPRHRPGVLIAAAAGLTSSVLLAACTTPDTSATPGPAPTLSSTTPTVSPGPSLPDPSSPDPSQQAEDAAVLAAYEGFWAAQVKTLNHPRKRPDPALRRYAIDKAYAGVAESLLLYRRYGIESRGKPLLNPTITDWSSSSPPTATVTDCVDSTHWQPFYVKTGKPAAAPGQAPREVVISAVTLYSGRWVVRSSSVQRGQTC